MTREPIIHVIVLDGTLSRLESPYETNAGLTYKLLRELAPNRRISLRYEKGIQWSGLRRLVDLAAGVGIANSIARAYGFIASRYQPGDRIFLFGYSRGAYAVRSLAGMIDKMGLLRRECAFERNINQMYNYYERDPDGTAAAAFSKANCHPETPIEMVGVWDTVKALGLSYPLLWRLAPMDTEFHSHELGNSIKHGFHALARDENRMAYAPVLWQCRSDFRGHVEQVWFRGAHADVGGHVAHFLEARPLSNIPLVWMLERAEACHLPLPDGWRDRFPMDKSAPAYGTTRGIAKFFLLRRRRVIGSDPSERVHPTAE